jgi:hypothetical protein
MGTLVYLIIPKFKVENKMDNAEHNLESQQTNINPSEMKALNKGELIAVSFGLVLGFPALLGGAFALVTYFSTLMANLDNTLLTKPVTPAIETSASAQNIEMPSAATLWRLRACIAKIRRVPEPGPQIALNDF